MHGPTLATLAVAVMLGLARASLAGPSDPADEARRRLARNEAVAAIAVLEGALPHAGPDREAILDLLRKSYEMAAKQAQAAGQARQAERYREDLKILNRKRTPAPATSTASPVQAEPGPSPRPEPLPEAAIPPASLPLEPAAEVSPDLKPDPIEPVPTPVAVPETPSPAPAAGLPSLPAEPPKPAVELSDGDFAFQAKNYAEAGRIYAALAREKKLPAGRMEHWAYCRSASVVERINAKPKTEAEWAAIDAEIDEIRAINPGNWLGEYLRNRASERLAGRKQAQPGKTVVRASSPEEPGTLDRPVRPASIPSTPRPAASTSPVSKPGASKIGTAVGRWQTRDTTNFRIYHADPALAEQVAKAAEAARDEQGRRWSGNLSRARWQPLCEIYLYPTAKQYAQMTGQPEDSPGFSTMGMNAGRIISRRISLRADAPNLVRAVLPHEITHVILADVFPNEQIPRWADEGLAVLSEPVDEQKKRSADLVQPLAVNQVFAVDALMNMDYPDNRFWSLYYAQSVSLTRFLVELGTPAQMIEFLQGSQRNGFEAELRRVYQIDGFGDLQRRWLAYAKNLEGARTASAPAPAEVAPDLKVR